MTKTVDVDVLNIIVLVALPSFAGGLISDYVNTIKGKYLGVKLGRVLASGAFATFLGFSGFYRFFISIDNTNLLMLICLLIGLVSFEIVQYLVTLDDWFVLAVKLKSLVVFLGETLEAFREIRRAYRNNPMTNRKENENNELGKGIDNKD